MQNKKDSFCISTLIALEATNIALEATKHSLQATKNIAVQATKHFKLSNKQTTKLYKSI
jgi:hypothetical protein